MTRADFWDTCELIPCLPKNAIDDISMLQLVSIEMERPFEKPYKSALSVSMA